MKTMMPDFDDDRCVHILPGDFAAQSWREAFPGRNSLVVDDPLSYGRLMLTDDLEAWKRLREKEIERLFHFSTDWTDSILKHPDRLWTARRIVIWVGSCLQEQITLPFIAHLLATMGAEAPVQCVQFGDFPSGRSSGVGILHGEELRTHPVPVTLTPAQLSAAESAWQALCAPTPAALTAWIGSQTTLPLLLKALRFLLRRYPQQASGLLYWDRKLLEQITEHGPSASHVIGYTMVEDSPKDDGDWMSDSYLWYRVGALTDSGLVRLSGNDVTTMRGTEVVLTTLGERVLSGEAKGNEVLPIDEWIGGVHLSSAEGRLWFYQNGEVRI